jgi:hypothetical protein
VSKTVQIRNVPDQLHRKLQARAAEQSVSLRAYDPQGSRSRLIVLARCGDAGPRERPSYGASAFACHRKRFNSPRTSARSPASSAIP